MRLSGCTPVPRIRHTARIHRNNRNSASGYCEMRREMVPAWLVLLHTGSGGRRQAPIGLERGRRSDGPRTALRRRGAWPRYELVADGAQLGVGVLVVELLAALA